MPSQNLVERLHNLRDIILDSHVSIRACPKSALDRQCIIALRQHNDSNNSVHFPSIFNQLDASAVAKFQINYHDLGVMISQEFTRGWRIDGFGTDLESLVLLDHS